MKFYNFYEDLLIEGRFFSEEKYNFIINNLGDLLFEQLIDSPERVQEIPEYQRFMNYLKFNTTVDVNGVEDVAYNVSHIGDWLRKFSDSDFSKIVNGIFRAFPKIKLSVDNFRKPPRDPNLPPSKRGRPPGSKNVKQPVQFSRELSRTKIDEPEDMIIGLDEPVAPKEPKSIRYLKPDETLRKRGRKPIDDGLTAMERAKYKQEGPEGIEKLKTKWTRVDAEVQKMIDMIHKIENEISKRKRYFGITD
jgi:hypothetical protein